MGLGNPLDTNQPLKPYNLLITNNWMALIKRVCDESLGFSINALGFAGYLLGTEESDIDWLYKNGPEDLLKEV